MTHSLIFLIVYVVFVNGCYWNTDCPYNLFGSKTPYDTIRGDIRDYEAPENCKAVSIWSLNRHGNRNPGTSVTAGMKDILKFKNEIITSYGHGSSNLCTQDIENLSKWNWNTTLEESQSHLTGTGYEEMYRIAKRIRQKYGVDLLVGPSNQFYFRPTNEQRTVTSCMAFVRGLVDETSLEVNFDGPWEKDDVIRPYQNCARYQQEVRGGKFISEQLETYFKSPNFVAVLTRVQKRLGIPTRLTSDNVFSIYEMCRFHRSWTQNLRDPWCAAFTDEDLKILEYYDDVRHYYRNGHGFQVNVDLGKIPLKDLYNNFNDVVNGKGKKIVAYFTHDTMMEMVWSAMGLYKDCQPINSLNINPDRLWRSSFVGAFSANLIAVLNRCNEGANQTYRVQLLINEALTPICPVEGCTWQQFKEKFQVFSTSNLDFCSMDYVYPEPITATPDANKPPTNSALSLKGFLSWF